MPRGCFSVKIVCQSACIYESGYDMFFFILLEGILHVTIENFRDYAYCNQC